MPYLVSTGSSQHPVWPLLQQPQDPRWDLLLGATCKIQPALISNIRQISKLLQKRKRKKRETFIRGKILSTHPFYTDLTCLSSCGNTMTFSYTISTFTLAGTPYPWVKRRNNSKVSCSITQVCWPGFEPTFWWLIATRTWIWCSKPLGHDNPVYCCSIFLLLQIGKGLEWGGGCHYLHTWSVSARLMAEEKTLTKISSSPGSGRATSPMYSFSGPPHSSNCGAFMVAMVSWTNKILYHFKIYKT